MRGVDRLSVETTALTQRGSVPVYLGSILLVLVALPGGALLMVRHWPTVRLFDTPAQLLTGIVMVVAAVTAASSRGRLRAVMLAGVTGYGVAVLFLLHGAPDLALTQVLVETVTLVVFSLVLRKLPKYFTSRPLSSSRWWRLVMAVLVGAVVVCIGLVTTGARTAVPVSETYPQVAYTFGYGRNVVNVTLVDIRSWDTMGEISVLVVAATGVASLIFLRSRYSARPGATRGTGGRGPAGTADGLAPRRRGPVPGASLDRLRGRHAGPVPGDGRRVGLPAPRRAQRARRRLRGRAGGRHGADDPLPRRGQPRARRGRPGRRRQGPRGRAGAGRARSARAGGLRRTDRAELRHHRGPGSLGSTHLVTSVFFDVGVYLVVVGVMLDLARSLGAGIDTHEAEDRAPSPGRVTA